MMKNVYWSSCKVPFIIVNFYSKLNILDVFSKNPLIPNFMKIRPVEAKLFHADGRKDIQDAANLVFFSEVVEGA